MRSDADIAETKPAEHIGPATVNILLIPDSFKGSLSSARLCAIMKAAAADVMPQAEVQAFPAADGDHPEHPPGHFPPFISALCPIRQNVFMKN